MLRRAISYLPGHVATSQRRGYLTLVLHDGTQYNLAVAWKSAAASPYKVEGSGSPQGGKAGSLEGEAVTASAELKPAATSPSKVGATPPQGKAGTACVTLNSVEGEAVIASAELKPAARFHSNSPRARGRERSMVDLLVWPDQSRACATVMRTNGKSGWTWQSSWSFDMEATPSILSMTGHTFDAYNEGPIRFCAPANAHLQFKGFIGKKLLAEFEVSMESHFKIKDTLGRGAEGIVYKCVSSQGGHLCAVKQYSSMKLVREEPREPRIMKMLSHPNVKTLYYAWKEDKPGAFLNRVSTIYLAQELCKGTIDDYLDKKTERNPHEELKVFKDAVLGLRYLHRQGIVHRDIKLGNLFLDNLHTTKIGDFGSGAFVNSNSCIGGKKFWATALYASPELWNCTYHGPKADIFSLGVVYFEVLGERATSDVRNRKLEELHKLLQNRHWKAKPLETWLKSNISKGWNGDARLLIQMLHMSPDRRPTCEQILLHLP